MYIFIILFILLDLLQCLIYALVLIWLGLENWCKRSVSPFFGATLSCVANFGGGGGSCGSYLGLLFILSLSVCACLLSLTQLSSPFGPNFGGAGELGGI